MESKDVIDADDATLGVLGSGAVGQSVLAVDFCWEDFVNALVDPFGVGGWGVAAGFDECHLCFLCLLWVRKELELGG